MLDRNGPDGALGEVLYRWASADRKRRVVEPLLSGGDERGFTARDIEYVCDLGLVAQDAPLRITNPIYAEVIPRELTWAAQEGFVEDTAWYVDADGELDMVKLL